jgi:FHA domain
MSLFSDIEKTIESGFRRWTERAFGPAQLDDLILLHRAILEQIESKVQVMARGKRVFPFPKVVVTLVSDDAERRALYEAAFGERLEAAVREALTAARCEIPKGFAVEVKTSEAGPQPFSLECSAASAVASAAAPSAPARLTIVRGSAQQHEYTLTRPRTNIGRMGELTDAEQRVVRRNDVIFEETADDASATVSRKHAHITLEAGEYRICDEGSEYGTRIFRDGRTLDVPPGNRRGEKLRSGDEIYLGRACLRFEQ